jgi:hypothetical protein
MFLVHRHFTTKENSARCNGTGSYSGYKQNFSENYFLSLREKKYGMRVNNTGTDWIGIE